MALGSLEELAGSSASQAIAFGLGLALGAVLEPTATGLRQSFWSDDPNRAPDPVMLAEAVARLKLDHDKAAEWATQHGFGADAFEAMVTAANVGPAIGQAFAAWRRGLLDDAEFETALHRSGLAAEWVAAVEGLKDNPLEAAEIAKAIHRGIMAGAGLLVSSPSSTPGKVPFPPPSPIDPVTEAAWSGVTAERLRVLVSNAGLPPGIIQSLQLLNRGEITEDDFTRVVAESNLRNEYAQALLALRRELLTAHNYAELQLRGYLDKSARDAGAALHGMTADDAELLYNLLGRSLPVRSITTGLARGGVFNGPTGDIPDDYLQSLQRGNLRPEYYNLGYANRYSLPSAFVIRNLATTGALAEADVESLLLQSGWRPDLAQTVASAWAGAGAAGGKHVTVSQQAARYEAGLIGADELRAELGDLGYSAAESDQVVQAIDARPVASARTALITKIRAGVVGGKLTDATASTHLQAAKVPEATIAGLLELWHVEQQVEATSK